MKDQLVVHALHAFGLAAVGPQIMVKALKIYQEAMEEKFALLDQREYPVNERAVLLKRGFFCGVPLRLLG